MSINKNVSFVFQKLMLYGKKRLTVNGLQEELRAIWERNWTYGIVKSV